MREILFRGKRVDSGEWVEGNLITSAAYPDRAWISESKTFFDRELQNVGIVEVDARTVCEYTGLQDKNGKKIFEGDIVKYIPIDQGEIGVYYYYIAFEDGYFRIGGTDEYISKIYSDEWEVVGNIHDNPELLEVK